MWSCFCDDVSIPDEVQRAFSLFVESNCVFGSDKFVQVQTMESAFAFYLMEVGINVGTFWRSNIEGLHALIPGLMSPLSLKITPGFTPFLDKAFLPIMVDTRCFVGITVLRLQK